MINSINNKISYYEAQENPVLSADSFTIKTPEYLWIFDVGASAGSLEYVENQLSNPTYINRCNIVISHFHEDHASNLANIKNNYNLYVSKYTYDRYKNKLGTNCISVNIINNPYKISDVQVFPIPSIHAKGCLGLQYDNYVLLGDSLYCKYIDGHVTYNQQLLREQKKLFESISAEYFISSHEASQIKSLKEIIEKINKILTYSVKDSPYIIF